MNRGEYGAWMVTWVVARNLCHGWEEQMVGWRSGSDSGTLARELAKMAGAVAGRRAPSASEVGRRSGAGADIQCRGEVRWRSFGVMRGRC